MRESLGDGVFDGLDDDDRTLGGQPPGPDVLVLRAVFVPDGEDPPADFQGVYDPLKLSATFDPATGELRTDAIGLGFGIDMPARWEPDRDSAPTGGSGVPPGPEEPPGDDV